MSIKFVVATVLYVSVFAQSAIANQRDFEVLNEFIQDRSPHYSVACNQSKTIEIKVDQGSVIKLGTQCENEASKLGKATFVEIVNELCACTHEDGN